MVMPLTITLGFKILLVWDVLVVNGTRHSLIFFKEPDYNIMIMSTFWDLTVSIMI